MRIRLTEHVKIFPQPMKALWKKNKTFRLHNKKTIIIIFKKASPLPHSQITPELLTKYSPIPNDSRYNSKYQKE